MEILCIGNALVDVFAAGEENVDLRYGLTKPVQHVEIGKLNEILSVLPEFEAVSGGGAANTAKIAGLLDADVGFVGALGKKGGDEHFDHFGLLFEKDLSSAGVKPLLVPKDVPTGICLILKTGDGETRIAASPSAALALSESDIDEKLIQEAGLIVIDGFMLHRAAFVLNILETASRYGTVAALDLSSAAIANEHAALILDIAGKYPLIIFMNKDEAGAFYEGLETRGLVPEARAEKAEAAFFPAERRNKDVSAFRRICGFFRDFTDGRLHPVIAVKLGPRGAICFAGGNVYNAETRAVIPLETTGAGDAFSAAFLVAWLRNKSIAECAALGNKAARLVLDVSGTKVDRKQFIKLARLLRQTAS